MRYIPEFLQKNALGLLLLATFIFLSKKMLTAFQPKEGIALLMVFILIVLTHYGTAGVAILYGIAILGAYLFSRKETKTIGMYGSLLLIAAAGAVAIFYLFDEQRAERVFFYLESSFGASYLGQLFSAESSTNQKLEAILSILIPILITLLSWRLFRIRKEGVSEENSLFWLSNIIFSYLLVLPVYDQLLFGRFALFLSLPSLFILGFVIHFSISKIWLKQLVVAVVALGILVPGFGEYMSLKFHNRDKEEVFEALMEVKAQESFQPGDLIITKNGAEHICNWFLGTKAGVITALNLRDFEKYENIYVLNPIEGRLNFEGIKGRQAVNPANTYRFMMSNIPKPLKAKAVFESEYLELFLLESAPEEWQWDHKGDWIGYTK